MLPLVTLCCLVAGAADGPWAKDFAHQPVDQRPALETCYTNGERTAFEVIASEYHVVGQLRAPHLLVDAESGETWLALTVTGADGAVYSTTTTTKEPSRINLYRRGPYFCEVHWFDVQVSNADGKVAPLKGDLALYCYPEKMLASIAWHAVEDFEASQVRYEGTHGVAEFTPAPFKAGTHQQFAFPVFNETPPLGDGALTTLDADRPLHYDAVRGCYTVGSYNPGGFEGHFFQHPDYREQVKFTIANDDTPRKVYICHETSSGAPGLVEGGVVTDAEGHPLPLTVQVSKNFAGEKEERFYNPTDIPFSENFFPLYLEAGESQTLSSIHLYQNWGSHMTKHFSSLGAWMDYFHSSTGVTETTCYVPFKYGGLPGVAIADFRAMSQDTFWAGQPQHDNVAGHSFLSYHDGEAWRYLTYRGTTYHSTGPNWMDITLSYLSSDGKIRATVRAFEYPQADDLRDFINVRYEVLEPVTIPNARENFRMLTVAWWVQRLRYTHVAASDMEDVPLTFAEQNFGVRGHPLPRENAFLAMYGEPKGSNGIVLRNWSGPVGPAASALCEKDGNTRLLLVPDADDLELNAGDVIAFEGFWLPYGEIDGARIPKRETVVYGSEGPKIADVRVGERVADFPPEVRAKDNKAEFTLQGGRSDIAVLVSGLSEYRWPRIWRQESTGWVPVLQARNGDLDGVQVYTAPDGSFGAAFIVATDGSPQRLKVQVGEPFTPRERIKVWPAPNDQNPRLHAALIQAPWMDTPISLRYPETIHTDALDFIDHVRDDMPSRGNPEELAKVWSEDAGGMLAFAWNVASREIGGRLSPNEDSVDLQFWVDNRSQAACNVGVQFCPILKGTLFDDPSLEHTWIHANGDWVKLSDTDRGAGDPGFCHYPVEGAPALGTLPEPWGVGGVTADADVVAVTSPDGKYVFAIAWPQARSILSNAKLPCVHADPILPQAAPRRRVHQRGKVYLMEGSLNDLYARVKREVLRKF